MTRFISTEDGYINLDRVTSISERALNADLIRPRWQRMQATVHWIDAEGSARASVADSSDVDPEKLTAPVVPAAPGYYLVGVCHEAPHAVWRAPVIAWRVVGDFGYSYGQPVCTDELPEGPLAILAPDGRVTVQGGAEHETLEEYRAAELRLRRRREAPAKGVTAGSVPA